MSNLIFGQLSASALDGVLSTAAVVDFSPTAHFGSWGSVPDVLPSLPYRGYEVSISALQSLFYGVESASLVRADAEFQALLRHFRWLVALAASSDIPNVLYGSPGTRSGRGAPLSPAVAASRVAGLADICRDAGVTLLLEVNAPSFGCEFITSNDGLFDLLEQLRHPGLGLHLDVGQMLCEGVDVMEVLALKADVLRHLHLSAPDYSLDLSLMPLFKDVLRLLSGRQVDVVLEVQSLGAAGENVLARACEELFAVALGVS